MARDRVLVVDDNEVNLKLAEIIMRKEGYDVVTAMDAESALASVRSCPPRLVLMDVGLPGMDGLEATRRLKADPATRHVVVVAVTAYAMKGDDERVREAGCDGYITKPIDTRTFSTVLTGILARVPALPAPAPAEGGA